MVRPRWQRALVAPVVLPHELGHALPATLAGLPASISLLPDWDGPETPLGLFDADLDRTTPLWLIRLIAVAPLPLALSVAALLRLVSLPAPLALAAFFLCAAAGTLSSGDVAVAANPAAARDAGQFRVPVAGWETFASDLSTVTSTLAVAAILFL
jgi:hypothetical protein